MKDFEPNLNHALTPNVAPGLPEGASAPRANANDQRVINGRLINSQNGQAFLTQAIIDLRSRAVPLRDLPLANMVNAHLQELSDYFDVLKEHLNRPDAIPLEVFFNRFLLSLHALRINLITMGLRPLYDNRNHESVTTFIREVNHFIKLFEESSLHMIINELGPDANAFINMIAINPASRLFDPAINNNINNHNRHH